MNNKKPVKITYSDGSYKPFPSIKALVKDEQIWNTLLYLGIANVDNEYEKEFSRVHRMIIKGLNNNGKYIIGNGLVTKNIVWK